MRIDRALPLSERMPRRIVTLLQRTLWRDVTFKIEHGNHTLDVWHLTIRGERRTFGNVAWPAFDFVVIDEPGELSEEQCRERIVRAVAAIESELTRGLN